MNATIRVLLVDDHAVLRAGLRMLLEAEGDISVVGEAASGEEGIRKAEALRPDVVVMDLSMPRMGGLEATRRITAAGLPVRVLVLTVDAEADSLMPVLAAGAAGYVTKTRRTASLPAPSAPSAVATRTCRRVPRACSPSRCARTARRGRSAIRSRC